MPSRPAAAANRLKPDSLLRFPIREAFRKGIRSTTENVAAMSVLLAAMSSLVVIYYFWPAGAALLSRYGQWQHAGGVVRAGLVGGLAGGVLSELSVIYVRDQGRWNVNHLENMAYRFAIFFFGGMVVAEFYEWQSIWFGDGLSWRVLLPKVLVDQFIFSVIWSTVYQTLTFRWQVLRYSRSRLWRELDGTFVIERMLPVMVTNWMFWIPGVTLIYSMPLLLQMPLNVFATAIWSLLLAGLAKPAGTPDTIMVPGPILTDSVVNPAE
jgi:hypothetical protein